MARPKKWKPPTKKELTQARDKARNLWWKAIMTIIPTHDSEMFDAIMNPRGPGRDLLGGKDRWPKRPQKRVKELPAPKTPKQKALPEPK